MWNDVHGNNMHCDFPSYYPLLKSTRREYTKMERTVRPQVIQTLNEMLEEERAAVEAVIGLTSMATDPTERENLMRIGGDEVWACSGLRDRIEALGGSSSRHVSDFASFVLSLEYFPERLRYYGRHQRLIMERITTLLTRKLDDETKVFLEEMYAMHEKDVNWCDERASVFEASRDLARHAGESTRFITDRVQHGPEAGRGETRYGTDNNARYSAEPQRNGNDPYRYTGEGVRYSETRYNNGDGARFANDSTRSMDTGRYGTEPVRGLPPSAQSPIAPQQPPSRTRLPRVPASPPSSTTPTQMPIALPPSSPPAVQSNQTKTPALPPTTVKPPSGAAVPPVSTPVPPPAAKLAATTQTTRVAPVKADPPPPPAEVVAAPAKNEPDPPQEAVVDAAPAPKVRRTRRKATTDETETKNTSE